ncbi:hypothetical protein GB937_006995 [Aspergillus fischeri]|nr:hypothetical protein GB937_006995 [Aspergillus fischeri]
MEVPNGDDQPSALRQKEQKAIEKKKANKMKIRQLLGLFSGRYEVPLYCALLSRPVRLRLATVSYTCPVPHPKWSVKKLSASFSETEVSHTPIKTSQW